MAQRIVGGETSLSDSEPHSDYDEPAEEAWRAVYGKLVKKLHCSTPLLEDLVGNGLLTQAELEDTKSRKEPMGKNDVLLTAMMRKCEEEIVLFCQLLFKHGQTTCGKMLQSSMSPYQTVRSSGGRPIPGDRTYGVKGIFTIALQPSYNPVA